MALVKKSRLVALLTIATIIFISIQFLFFTSLKSVLSDSASNDIFLNKTIIIRELVNREITTRKHSQKVSQFKIPLDSNNQPELVNLLPFYNRMNHFNFTLYFIDEQTEITETSKSQFVAIESENRLTDKTLLKKYDTDLTNDLKSFRGININKIYLYKPDANGYFKCLNSNQRILFSNLNDDYCDCVDATDEPGTSACQFSIFYCSNQNEFLNENYIVSSKVDDKICDCCDGSDESEPFKCPNTCDMKIQEAQKQLDKKKLGKNLKRKYLVEGLFKNEQIYGPQGVFYSLSKTCYEINWTEYTFEVCPYKKVLQYKRNQKSHTTNVGEKASLVLAETQHDKIWILKMDHGDSQHCNEARRSEIRLLCGDKTELKQVQEPSKCVYEFDLITPAAC